MGGTSAGSYPFDWLTIGRVCHCGTYWVQVIAVGTLVGHVGDQLPIMYRVGIEDEDDFGKGILLQKQPSFLVRPLFLWLRTEPHP